MNQVIENLLAEGYRLHTQGYLDEALRRYEEALRISPDSFDALHLLGVLFLQRSESKMASGFLQKAVKLKPRNTEALVHLGSAQAGIGDYAFAKASFEKALKIEPTNSGAAANLGLVLVALGDWVSAEKFLKRATLLDPANFDAQLNLGNVKNQTGRFSEALDAYRKAAALQPEDIRPVLGETATLINVGSYQESVALAERALAVTPEIPELIENKALALKGLGDLSGALAALRQALDFRPESASILSNLGDVYNEMGMFDEAIEICSKATRLAPDMASAYNNLGLAYMSEDRHEDAVNAYKNAIKNNRSFSQAYNNLGIVLSYLNQLDDALASFNQALSLDPLNAHARMTKAVTLLAYGFYTDGWQFYNSRFKARGEPEQLDTWQGNPFDGTLIVNPEQGIGDQILFASMLSDLAKVHAAITVKVDPRLISLFSRSFPGVSFVAKDQGPQQEVTDRSLPMGSLGKYFRTNPKDFARAPVGYLTADPEQVCAIRNCFQSSCKKVGISWRSSEKKYGIKKSLSLLEWLPLLSLPDIEFIDLQYGDTEAERNALKQELGVSVTKLDIDNMQELDRLAALIKGCDAVVTISNSTAHLAGALGVPTLVMAPRASGRLWYWNRQGGSSDWYPTVKVINMPIGEDWSVPIYEIQKILKI